MSLNNFYGSTFDPLAVKYLIILLIAVPILLGSLLVDKNRRLGRGLRVFGYLFIVLFVVLDIKFLHILTPLSYLFLLLLGSIGIAVTFYTEGYSRVLFGMARPLQLPVEILSIALLLLFSSTLLIEFVMFWILTELVGFMIIVFEGSKESWRAAITYLVVGALTADISLFTILAITAQRIGLEKVFSATISSILAQPVPAASFLTILVLIGFIAKSALVPLHFWLPDAYTTAPSPASALFSGVMEKMSVFGIILVMHMLRLDYDLAGYILLVLGTITVFYAATQAILQSDAKRLLSYSTMGYSGCLMCFVGLYALTGFPLTILAIILLMYAHGFSKTLLFMNAGSMEILVNTRDIYKLGYLARIDRNGAFTIVMGGLSLLGVPSTIGFIGKFFAFLTLMRVFVIYGPIAVPAILALIYLSSAGLVYTLKYLGSYYGGYMPAVSGVTKYYLLDWGEALAVIGIMLYGVIGSIVLYKLGLSLYIIVIDVAVLLALLLALYMIKSGKFRFREDEAWVGGAYP